MLAPSGQAREIALALSAVARRARRDRGCVSSDVYEAVGEKGRFRFDSEWADEECVARHVRSEDFTQLLALVDQAVEPPQVQFTVGGTTRGLEYVAEIRAS